MRLPILLATLFGVGLALGVAVSHAGETRGSDTMTAETTTTSTVAQVTVRVGSIVNEDGIIVVALTCPGSIACKGSFTFPQLGPDSVNFSIGAGKKASYRYYIAGPLHATARALKTIRMVIEQAGATSDQVYSIVQAAAGAGGGPGSSSGPPRPQNGNDGPTISAGPASRTEFVRDPRGDNRSSFPLPIVYDIVSASARRSGNAIVFSVTTVQPMTMHDGYGNPVTPCIELPFYAKQHTPMMALPSGDLAGASSPGKPLPKIAAHVSGRTVQFVVPRKYLFRYGFLWRATGGCDASHVADVAPNKGFKTFRWVAVT